MECMEPPSFPGFLSFASQWPREAKKREPGNKVGMEHDRGSATKDVLVIQYSHMFYLQLSGFSSGTGSRWDMGRQSVADIGQLFLT